MVQSYDLNKSVNYQKGNNMNSEMEKDIKTH